MAATTFSGTHTIVGTTNDGKKIVFSDIVPQDANFGTVSPTIIPSLVKIDYWAVGIKDAGDTPTTFVTALGSDTSYLSGSNTFYITAAADATGAKLCIMSVGD